MILHEHTNSLLLALHGQAAQVPDLKVAISDNLGFGGHNGVVAFRKLD